MNEEYLKILKDLLELTYSLDLRSKYDKFPEQKAAEKVIKKIERNKNKKPLK